MQMDDSTGVKEMVSDLMDGRLRGEDLSDALDLLQSSRPALHVWRSYHAVGDLLRNSDMVPVSDSDGFLGRLQQRMMLQEPAEAPAQPRAQPAVVQPVARPSEAANDGDFSWKRVVGFASLLVVAALGWNSLRDGAASQGTPQLAAVRVDVPDANWQASATQEQVMLRDPRLDELIAAHRQSGGNSALQVPAGFLRNATFEVSSQSGLAR